MSLESEFKTDLVKRLREMVDGFGFVLHLDPNEVQGIPDILILYKNRWATLEGKRSLREPYRPNQKYYIDMMNNLSFSSMICPENEEEVLDELQQALGIRRRRSRISQS